MTLLYGNTQSGNRPGCWGRLDVYDSEGRECRGCGFQSSCRDNVIKQTINNQQAVQQVSTGYYSPYQQPMPFAPAPAPMAITPYQAPAPAPVQVARFVAPAPVVQQQPVRVPAPIPTQLPQQAMHPGQMQHDWYGRMQDPLFFQILQPPPFRAQVPGESFGQRFIKNLALDLGTMAFFHAGLALRQMFLPPKPPDQP